MAHIASALAVHPVVLRLKSSYCAMFHEPDKTPSTGGLITSVWAHRQHF